MLYFKSVHQVVLIIAFSIAKTCIFNLPNTGTEHIHPEALEELQSIVESVKQGYFEEIYEEYEVNSFYEVLFLEVYHMILDRVNVK